MTLDLSEVKKIAVLCGLFVGENISGIALVVKKDEDGYHNHITLEELQSFAKACYAMGAAEQKERDSKICEDYPKRDPGEDGNGYWAAENCAEAIRSQE